MTPLTAWLEENISLHSHDNPAEERVSSITHAVGALLAIGGTLLMVLKAGGRASLIPGVLIYGFSMILLYSASALYHWVKPGNIKRICRILDHSNIYFLIAGTYTPFCFAMDSPAGRLLLGLVWITAFLGVIFTLRFWGRLKPLHVILYLAMGWLVVFFWQDLKAAVSPELTFWMLAGGITYSLGTLVYASKKVPYYHGVWHLFVLGGSLCFYIGIYLHIL